MRYLLGLMSSDLGGLEVVEESGRGFYACEFLAESWLKEVTGLGHVTLASDGFD